MDVDRAKSPDLSVILVSYNSRRVTLDALTALYADLQGAPAEVWVVDNASTDGSVAAIHDQFPDAKLIANEDNRGFGAANNQAMKVATGKFFLLLNSDAFVQQGTVAALLQCAGRHPGAGVVGPRLQNRDGSLQQSCFRFPTPPRIWMENLWLSALFGDYRHWRHDQEREVEWIAGACLLVRREVFDRVGPFDERFFLYSEETDWERRIRAAGWRIVFTPAARVTHLGGASGGGNAAVSRYFFQSLDRYELKHHGRAGLLSLRAAMIIGCAMRALAWAGVWIVAPRRRQIAGAKLSLHAWLVKRQLTHWRVSAPSPGPSAGAREPASQAQQWGVA